MSISTTFDDKEWKIFAKKIDKVFSKSDIDKTLKATAWYGQKEFVKELKSKSINWTVKKDGNGYKIVSLSKVALFLEEGTGRRGPNKKYIVPKRGKYLYIPLRPNAATWREGLVYGKDYVLAKRSKGIKPRHYFEPVSQQIARVLERNFKAKLIRAGY